MNHTMALAGKANTEKIANSAPQRQYIIHSRNGTHFLVFLKSNTVNAAFPIPTLFYPTFFSNFLSVDVFVDLTMFIKYCY